MCGSGWTCASRTLRRHVRRRPAAPTQPQLAQAVCANAFPPCDIGAFGRAVRAAQALLPVNESAELVREGRRPLHRAAGSNLAQDALANLSVPLPTPPCRAACTRLAAAGSCGDFSSAVYTKARAARRPCSSLRLTRRLRACQGLNCSSSSFVAASAQLLLLPHPTASSPALSINVTVACAPLSQRTASGEAGPRLRRQPGHGPPAICSRVTSRGADCRHMSCRAQPCRAPASCRSS